MTRDAPSDLALLCRGRPVLVIDDEKFSRSIVLRHLKDAGVADAVQAENATTGLQELVARPHGCCAAICDFNMPLLTGLHFLKAVRTGFEGIANHLPVIMLTGYSDSSLVGAALQLDVDAFVVKPVSRATLESRLHHALAGAQSVSPPESYARIDVDAVTKAVLMQRVAAAKVTTAGDPPGEEMAVGRLQEGLALAEDLVAPSGELLLAAGFRLSARMVNRLKELSEMGIVPAIVRVR